MTQWRTQTATFSQDNPIDNSADFFQTGLFIGKDGTKLYHTDANDLIYEYDMTTPYDISTLSLLQSKDITAQTTAPRDIWFTPDGLTMFVLASDRVFSYNLSTAWNVSTAVFNNSATLFQDTNHNDMYFRADGLLMFTIGNGSSTEGSADRIYKYDLTTPYDLTTLSFTSLQGSFHVSENLPTGIFFEDNGLRMFVLGATDTIFTSDSTMWEYPLSVAWNITTTSAPTELNLEANDTTPFGVHFLDRDPNRGARFWHGGREFDKIYEWTMAQTGVEKGITINAILTLEFVEVEMGAKVVNRFDTGGALQVGARLVVFCDYVDTNVGWIQTDPNNQIFVDEGGFPDRIHFERVPAGGGATRRWVGKNTGKTVSGDVKFEFKFDLIDDHPTLNFSATGSVLLADSFNHQNEATAVGRSYIGFSLTIVRSEGRHIFYGRLSDGTTTVTTIEGGTQNQHTHEIYKQTSTGTDIQKGPYYCTIELKDNLLRTSIFLDSARTQHMRGSPREADATGINPTNLQHLIVSNTLGGGSARELVADFDEFCFTQNEPLKIIPKKPFPAVGQFTEGWETFSLGDQNPTPWVSSNTLLGASATVDIDIHQVSNESPEEGTQAFKQHFKHTQTGSGSTTARAILSRLVGPAVVNTDGSGIDLARFLTARQKADILNGAFNAKASGVTIIFSTLSGGPGIGQMQLTLFGAGNMFGSNSGRLNLNSPLGTYAGFERFDLKLLLDTDSFLSNNQGVDWENHVKFVTIRFGAQTRSDVIGSGGEALLNNDYMALWGTKLDIFLVDALLKKEGVVTAPDQGKVNAILVLVDQVQLKPKMGAVLKKLDQEKEFFIGAEIGAFETEVFFSSTHFQDITPLVSGVGMENKEFTVTGKVVIRTAVNSAIVSAFLKRLGVNLCVGETGIFFQDNFNGDGNGAGNIGWDINDFRIRIDIFGFDNIFRIVDLQSTQLPTGIARGVKAFQKPFAPDIDFMWEFKHVHFRGKDDPSPFASQIQMTLKETSNDIIPGASADETTIKYRTDRVTSTGPEGIRLEVFDKNAVNSVFSPNAMTIRDNGFVGFTFYPRITKTGNTIKLEMFIDEERTTLAFVGVAGGLISGVPVVEVDVTGFDFSQDLGFIWIGNYAGGGPAIRANEEFDDIFVFTSKCPRFDINSLLQKTDIEEFRVKALLKGPRQVDPQVNAILRALDKEQEFIIDALIGDINIVEYTVDAFIQQQGIITIPPQFRADALLQAQGVITPPSQPTVDAILVITIIATEEEFEVSAVLGLGEFQSILDVESVIGSKTGSQTVI